MLFKLQTTQIRKRLPFSIPEFNNLYVINHQNQLLLSTYGILFYIKKCKNHMMINGRISGTMLAWFTCGMINGTISGMVFMWRNARGIP